MYTVTFTFLRGFWYQKHIFLSRNTSDNPVLLSRDTPVREQQWRICEICSK